MSATQDDRIASQFAKDITDGKWKFDDKIIVAVARGDGHSRVCHLLSREEFSKMVQSAKEFISRRKS